MIIENSEALQKWIACRLVNICYGDPCAVSKYILALIKKDKKENELYKFCLDQLEVFLSEGTEHFVDLLFDTLKTKSYILQVKTSNRKSLFTKCVTESSASKVVKREKTSAGEGSENLTSSVLRKALKQDGTKYNEESEKCLYVIDENNQNLDEQQISRISDLRQAENTALFKGKKEEWKYSLEYVVSDYHTSSVSASTTRHNKSIIGNIIQRCQDYHEKGYCMQGYICQLDYGIDPVVIADLSIVNFGISGSANVTSKETVLPKENCVMIPITKDAYNSQVLLNPLQSCPYMNPSAEVLSQPSSSSSSSFKKRPSSLSYPSLVQPVHLTPSLVIASYSPSIFINQKLPAHKISTSSPSINLISGKKRKEWDYNPFEVKPKKASLESTNVLKVSKVKDVKDFSSSIDYVPKSRQSKDFQTLNRRLELHKKKQKLLDSLIQHEKFLLSELDKAKTKKIKVFLKKAVLDLASKITSLEADVKKSSEELMTYLKSYKIPESMFKGKKELLDAEMDLYNKQYKGEDTDELLSKMNKLKQKIKDLGLMVPSAPIKDELNKKTGLDQFYHTYQTKSQKDFKPFASPKSDNNPIVTSISNFHFKDACKENLVERFLDDEEEEEEDSVPRSWRW